MALYRLGLCVLGALALVAGCHNQKPDGQTQRQPVVEVTPDAQAVADVDKRATLALKQTLLTDFPQGSASASVEVGLVKAGFKCGANPSAPIERACLKAVREGPCEVNTIVTSEPYTPQKAQVIKICEVGAPPPIP